MEGPAPAGVGDVGSGRLHDAVRIDSDAAEHRHGRDRHRYSLPMQVGFVNSMIVFTQLLTMKFFQNRLVMPCPPPPPSFGSGAAIAASTAMVTTANSESDANSGRSSSSSGSGSGSGGSNGRRWYELRL